MAEVETERPASARNESQATGPALERNFAARIGGRFIALSKPKMSKTIWATSYEPRLVWGNQETIWPLSPAALKAVASERVEFMAKHKEDHQTNHPQKCCRPEFQYSCGRPSVIWDVSPTAMKASPSDRTEALSRHKTAPSGFQEDRPIYDLGCGRSSTIWVVSEPAKNASERPYTERLAHPKKEHHNFRPCRDVQWPVSAGAMRCGSRDRTELLSMPKHRSEGGHRPSTWTIKRGTLFAAASERTHQLAKPKKLPDKFVSNRDVEWKIPRSALRSHTSERIKNMSQPIVRDTMDHLQFNPDAFKVSENAKRAKISRRVDELAEPIQRGLKLK